LIKDKSVRELFTAYEKAFNALDFTKSAEFLTDSFPSAGAVLDLEFYDRYSASTS